jgi:hypothetical protein
MIGGTFPQVKKRPSKDKTSLWKPSPGRFNLSKKPWFQTAARRAIPRSPSTRRMSNARTRSLTARLRVRETAARFSCSASWEAASPRDQGGDPRASAGMIPRLPPIADTPHAHQPKKDLIPGCVHSEILYLGSAQIPNHDKSCFLRRYTQAVGISLATTHETRYFWLTNQKNV